MTENDKQAFAQHLEAESDQELARALVYYPRKIKKIEDGKSPTFSLEDARTQYEMVQQEHTRRTN